MVIFSFVFSSTYAGLLKTKENTMLSWLSPPLFTAITALIISFFKKLPYSF